MKWIAKYIYGFFRFIKCTVATWVVNFTKWAISHLGHNTYIKLTQCYIYTKITQWCTCTKLTQCRIYTKLTQRCTYIKFTQCCIYTKLTQCCICTKLSVALPNRGVYTKLRQGLSLPSSSVSYVF